MPVKQVVILAGGKGSRLSSRLKNKNGVLIPKPLVAVGGIPLLERQILYARDYGITQVLLLVNHLSAQIDAFCKSKENFGIHITLMDDGMPRGTAGAILSVLDQLEEEFLVMYGDTLLNVNLERFYNFHKNSTAEVTLFLHPNDHPQDSDLVEINIQNKVTRMHPYPHPQGTNIRNLVNAALYLIRKEALLLWKDMPIPMDFAKHLLPRMLEKGQLITGYVSPEYIKDVGTPERLDEAEEDLVSGRFAQGNLCVPQKAVFLDRDGVINQEVGHISHPKQLKLIPGSAEAIRRINKAGFLAIVVTNQPVIARGDCDEACLQSIHNQLENYLGMAGAYLDRIYYCPHHPDKGFPGERSDLKISCQCRKPEPGLLFQAHNDLNIDLSQSWLVGDSSADILAAERAGVRSILVKTGAAGTDGKYYSTPTYTVNTLTDAVDIILSE